MANYRNQKRIYLNTFNCPNPAYLQEYGFTYDTTRKAWVYSTGNLGKYRKPALPSITLYDIIFEVRSQGAATLEVICKMYKDGIIRFKEINTIQSRINEKEKKIRKLQAEIDKLKKEME